ncbi:Hypothetical protein R9X50_00098100 [Acrodontium crateriforme]|uniref:Trichothecene 3-O-acetyltransferase n=1 Tax=Acrodontium crateriforme TaxID=150365 RepID=A0AAQ3LYK0_9PEZI|nr:Hypothetical protein R9X50_00098100 [Acrodontium crateriforme]
MDTICTVVAPDEQSWGCTIKLSPIDQIAPRDYNVLHLFFRLGDDFSNRDLFRQLETAVLKTARDIPQLACGVRKCANSREELELAYSANFGAHVVFRDLVPIWPHGNFDSLAKEHFPMPKLERRFLLNIDYTQEVLPGLVIQANFIEGGLILTTALHHTICDGTGVSMFHQALARHLRGSTMSDPWPCLEPTINERVGIVSPSTGVHLEEFPHWKRTSGMESFLDPVSFDGEATPVRYSIYSISETKSQELRDRLVQEGGVKVSISDAISAFIWVHVLRARNIDTDAYPNSKLSITVDARSRMTDCHVPTGYWGNFSEPNAVACMCTKFMCGEVSEENTTGMDQSVSTCDSDEALDWSVKLPKAARRVKQAIAAVDNSAVRRLVGLLHQMPKATSLTWNVNRWPGPDMLIVGVNRFPTNIMQYGPLGYSEATRISIGNTEEKPDGRCILLPAQRGEGRGLEIALQYDFATLDRLKESKQFAEYFTWRN